MIRITQDRSAQAGPNSSSAHHYVIAGQALVFQSRVDTLGAFEQGPATDQFSELLCHVPAVELLTEENAQLKYSGEAQLDGEFRLVHFWRNKEMAQIDVEGVPYCRVNLREEHIHVLNSRPFDDRLNLEIVTGPALVILLAQKGIYCLHAGAIAIEPGNVAMVAESGSGKSTLSAHNQKYWQQISDDILPLRLSDDHSEIEILADFPQLKLENASVPSHKLQSTTLDYILRINPEDSPEITFNPLNRTEALLQIVRHTVGARLFDKPAMKMHAKFAKKISGLVPMVEIAYPRKLGQLSELRQRITEHFASAAPF